MKRIAIMQPYFFPYLGYFQLIRKSDAFLLYGHVDYTRRSYITRNSLVTNKGKIESIRVATVKMPLGSKIKDVTKKSIACNKLLRKKIETIYSRSPFFDEVYPRLVDLIETDTDSLMEYNSVALESISKMVGVDTPFIPWVEYEKDFSDIEAELANNRYIKTKRASARVFKLCRNLGYDAYLNPEGGMKLYNTAEFNENGISLSFHKADVSLHRKNFDIALRHSSIIDVLMLNGISTTSKLVECGKIFNTD